MANELEKKFLGTAGVERLVENVRTEIADSLEDAKGYADSLAENYDASGTAETKVRELAEGQVKTNTDAIAKLNGDASTEGSVAKAVADAKTELNASIDAVDEKIDGEGGLSSRVGALETDMGDVDNLETTKKSVVEAINEVRQAVGTGGTAAVITIETTPTTEGALKSYIVKQGGELVGTIDIPKDMVVQEGTVEVNPAGQEEGTYIKLVLANVAEPLYINVGTLVDIYKAKANAAQVQLSIDSTTREISATIVAGAIGTAELADNSVTTAKIADANVTKAKLATSVQTSLDKADAAAPQTALDAEVGRAKDAEEALEADVKTLKEKPSFNITADDITNWNDAVAKEHEHENADVLDGITAAKVDAWDSAKQGAIDVAATDATNKANAAEKNAKDYADAEIAKIDLTGIAQNAEDIDNIEASLAEGGATANAIADAKSAGTNAQANLNTLIEGDVAELKSDVADLKSVTYVEITTAEIDAMFGTEATA